MTVRFIGLGALLPKCAICGAASDERKTGVWDLRLVGGTEVNICPDCKRAHPDPIATILERARREGAR